MNHERCSVSSCPVVASVRARIDAASAGRMQGLQMRSVSSGEDRAACTPCSVGGLACGTTQACHLDPGACPMAESSRASQGFRPTMQTDVQAGDGMGDRGESSGNWLPCSCSIAWRAYAYGIAETALGGAFCRREIGEEYCSIVLREMSEDSRLHGEGSGDTSTDQWGESDPYDEGVSARLYVPRGVASNERREDVENGVHDRRRNLMSYETYERFYK